MLTHALEMRHRFVARQHAARHWLVFGRQRGHAFFNRCEVLQSEGPFVGKVVEKTVLYHRADGDLRVWKQFFYRIGQQVSGGMADNFEAVCILGRNNGQGAVSVHLITGVDDLPIYFARQSRLRKAGTNGGCNFGHGNWRREIALGTIGQGNFDHDALKTVAHKKARTVPRFFVSDNRGRTGRATTAPWFRKNRRL